MAGTNGPHQGKRVLNAGLRPEEAQAAMILVHGRGATAEDILMLGRELDAPDFTYIAPQAANYTWYPYSFLAPMEQNEPGLSSGLAVIEGLVQQLEDVGIPAERIILAGFSQGACLASEFVARHARRYGGLLVFSGGLIGPPGSPRDYEGSLDGMPVFLGCSDVDPHIPAARVNETEEVLMRLGADVTKKLYPNMPHTIIQDEIDQARRIVARVTTAIQQEGDEL